MDHFDMWGRGAMVLLRDQTFFDYQLKGAIVFQILVCHYIYVDFP